MFQAIVCCLVRCAQQGWEGAPSSKEAASDIDQAWLQCRTPGSQLLKLPDIAARDFSTENEFLDGCPATRGHDSKIEEHSRPKVPVITGQRCNGIRREQLHQSHCLNVTDTFRNIQKGAGWKESREFIEQRHPLPGDDIVPITCCLSDSGDWSSEGCDSASFIDGSVLPW